MVKTGGIRSVILALQCNLRKSYYQLIEYLLDRLALTYSRLDLQTFVETMKTIATFVLLALSTFALAESGTRFAVIGYTYQTLNTPALRDKLIDHVNQEGVDHVFILGDADLWDPDVVNQYKNGFNAPVYFAPGNHETMDDEREVEEQYESYLANVGYDRKVIRENDVNFITVNSGDDIVTLNAFLADTFQDLPDNPTVMLGHHRIWDDNRTSPFPNGQYKSYLFSEFRPALRDNVDLIFSGNSARIYFGSPGKSRDVNNNIAYWCDIVDGVRGCSVGMKNPSQATYVVATVLNKEVLLAPRAFAISPGPRRVITRPPDGS